MKTKFDPASKDPQVYEKELKLLSCHALLNEALNKPFEEVGHFAYVLE